MASVNAPEGHDSAGVGALRLCLGECAPNERQEAVSFWERSTKPPRSDVLAKMATVLGVTVEDILGVRTTEAKPQPLGSAPGPTSEIQKVFEEVRKLPRRQQRKVLEMVTAFVDMYSRKAS